jgi:hypothetical protein|tara:strand:- start:517 stop:642 length:126 start_codon:yes stop_codon:yes gene_type:complete
LNWLNPQNSAKITGNAPFSNQEHVEFEPWLTIGSGDGQYSE